MQAVPLTTIAALLRHSTTSLVRRYAHLNPSYLKEAIEEVSAFGLKAKPEEKSGTSSEENGPISDGTVTRTGNTEKEAVENPA
jgi:hypothetical protein